MILKEWKLHYCAGTSDKVYIARIDKRSDGFYYVACEYGRRGAALRPADKGIHRTLAQAETVFYDVVGEKTAKGYVVTERNEPGETEKVVEKVKATLEPIETVSATESKECGEDAREKALARLKASSVW